MQSVIDTEEIYRGRQLTRGRCKTGLTDNCCAINKKTIVDKLISGNVCNEERIERRKIIVKCEESKRRNIYEARKPSGQEELRQLRMAGIPLCKFG